MNAPKPHITVRPQFVSSITSIEAVLIALLATLMVTVAGGTLLMVLLSLIGLMRLLPGWLPFFLCFTAAAVVVPPLYFELKRKAYAKTWFAFYDDYVEYQFFDWLVNRRAGRIKYTDIANMAQNANALQEREKLKTIYLYVPDQAYQNPRGFAGLKLKDVPAGKGYGYGIQELIDRAQKQNAAAPATPYRAPEAQTADVVTGGE